MARIPRKLAGRGASDMADASAFDAYVGPARELVVDPTRGIIALHDGATVGGKRFANASQGAKADSAVQPDTMTTAIEAAMDSLSEEIDNISSSYDSFDGLNNTVISPDINQLIVAGRSTAGDGGDSVILVGNADLGGPASLKGRTARASDGAAGQGRYLRYVREKALPTTVFGIKHSKTLDQTAKMQSAIDSQLDIIIPGGTIIGVSAPLTTSKNGQSIFGQGPLSTIGVSNDDDPTASVLKNLGFNGDILKIGPSSGFWTGNGIRDLVFDCQLALGGHGFTAIHIQRLDVQNIYVYNPKNGIYVNDLNTPYFHNVRVVGAQNEYAWCIEGRYGDGNSTDALKMVNCTGGGSSSRRATDGSIVDPTKNNNTIGLWLRGSVAGGFIFGYTGQSVRNSIYCSIDESDAGHYPAGLTFVRCGGDFLAGPTIYIDKGVDMKIFHPYSSNNQGITTQDRAGDGMVFTAGARDIDIITGDVKSSWANGVFVDGENIRFIETNIYRNGAEPTTDYDNVVIGPNAKRISFINARMGHNIYNVSTGNPVDGLSRYNINIDPAVSPGQVVIGAGCDLRGAKTKAINNAGLALFPFGVPLGVDAPGPNQAVNGRFQINQEAWPDGPSGSPLSGNSFIRDRWKVGSSTTIITTAADGALILGSGSSLNQTVINNPYAGKTAWIAAKIKVSGVYTSYTGTLKLSSINKAFTVLTPSDNGYVWVAASDLIPAGDTGDRVFGIVTGSRDLQIAEIRFGLGEIPDIWSAPRDPHMELLLCKRHVKIITAGGANEMFGIGRATSATNARIMLDLGEPMGAAVNSISFTGSFQVAYGSASSQAVTAMAIATGGGGFKSVAIDATSSGLTTDQQQWLRAANSTGSTIKVKTGY